MQSYINIKTREQGWVSTVIILILIASIFVYYFSSGKKNNLIDIGDINYKGYLDYNIAVLDTLSLLEINKIELPEGEAKSFKNKNFTLNIKRGENLKVDNGNFSCYLLEAVNELDPTTGFQYGVIGIPDYGDHSKYYVISYRQKLLKG